MSKNKDKDFRDIIFARYIGQFLQANDSDTTIRKSSEEIAFDLSGMASFSADGISERMIQFGYRIGFDDQKPVWLLKEDNKNQIKD
ncbi:hypothetical protein [Dysgonomonas macrotermitis]|uniref:Uncharacterized protein n=1 Tax=Dysgonomonas macrotermitis TaxID=1346286 RepID=A0A1M4UJL7_9BACT|nr:hypothetical protein [Dysgonomonas macrotermitis]SHE56848.1 hypothetical protein SAMN05444362_101622 [Dysgonomonas macrotermitis]